MPTSSLLWLPWTVLLSGVPAYFAWRAWTRGERAAAVRRCGWALLPWSLWLLGAMTLLGRVGDAVVDWAVRFAFNPAAWIGMVVGVVGVGLVVVGLRLGSGPSKTREPRREVSAKKSGDEDLDEIESILRKHGIQ